MNAMETRLRDEAERIAAEQLVAARAVEIWRSTPEDDRHALFDQVEALHQECDRAAARASLTLAGTLASLARR
jgi:hypothetical protein